MRADKWTLLPLERTRAECAFRKGGKALALRAFTIVREGYNADNRTNFVMGETFMAARPDDSHIDVSISRRNFLRGSALAAGALSILGFSQPAAGSFSIAYADETGATDFVVYALSREDVPIVVIDVANGANAPVAGMKITVTSLYNDARVTATTDAFGCATVGIRALTDGAGDAAADGYAGWMHIQAEKAGYRTYIEESRLMESGFHANDQGVLPNMVQIATQPDANTPYLSCVCFDGVDFQYRAQRVGITSANDMVHDLVVRIEHAGGSTWNVALANKTTGATVGSATAQAASDAATATITGTWLDGAHGISAGDALAITFSNGTTTYEFPLSATFVNVQMPVTGGYDGTLSLSPGNDPEALEDGQPKKATKALPDFFGSALGDMFTAGVPFLPVDVFCDGLGNVGFTATIATCNIFKKERGADPSAEPQKRWKIIKDTSGGNWVDTFVADLQKNAQRWSETSGGDGSANGGKNFGASKVASKFDVTFDFQLQGYGSALETSDSDKWLWHFDVAALGRLAAKVNVSQQLCVCGIPVFWAFDFSAMALLKFMLGCRFRSDFSDFTWGHEWSIPGDCPAGVVFNFRAELGLTAGVGVIGIASVGVRGYGFFDIMFMSDSTTDYEQKHHYPHTTIGIGAAVQMIVQVLMFKKTVMLVSTDSNNIYDSDDKYKDDSSDKALTAGALALPDARFGSEVAALTASAISSDDLEMVDDSSLLSCVEFTVAPDAQGALCDYAFCGTQGSSDGPVDIIDPYAQAPEVALATPNGGFGAQAAAGLFTATSGYNPIHGVRPSFQTKLWSDAFSAPRPKVVRAGDYTYMLRIAVVEVDVDASNADLCVVADDSGCTFVKAVSENALAHISLADDGSLVYPEYNADIAMAQFVTFDGDTVQGDMSANRRLVEELTRTDSRGRAVNATKVTRSRLIISRYYEPGAQWLTPSVLEFAIPATATEYMRVNTWDTDFDVAVSDTGMLYVALTSIVRPYYEDKTYDEQFKRQFISLLRVDPYREKVIGCECGLSSMLNGAIYWQPRVVADTNNDWDDATMFYYRTNLDARGDLDISNTVLRAITIGFYVPTGDMTITISSRILKFEDSFITEHLSEGSYEVVGFSMDNTFQKRGAYLTWSVPALPQGASQTIAAHDAVTVFSVVSLDGNCIEDTKRVDNVSFAAHGPISTTDSTAHVAWFYTLDSGRGQERLLRRMEISTTYRYGLISEFTETWPVGSTSNVLKFFSSIDGKHLFAARIMEGTAPSVSEEAVAALADGAVLCSTVSALNSANAELAQLAESVQAQGATAAAAAADGETVRQFQLLSAVYDEDAGAFQDFFPLAELDFAPDFIAEVPDDSEYHFNFIAGAITDFDNNLLDLYHVLIPRVCGLQLEGADAVTHLCMPGDPCVYQVRVTNTGNTSISGFTANVFDAETGAAVDSVRVPDLASALCDDVSNVVPVYDESGEPTGAFEKKEATAIEAQMIWPGQTRTYQTTFTMPASTASGERGYHVTVSNPERGMLLAADEAALCVDPRKRLIETCTDESGTVSMTVQPANYTVGKASDDSGNGRTPTKTGDNAGVVIAAAAVAAAAVGTGVAAKQMKRAAESDGDGDIDC